MTSIFDRGQALTIAILLGVLIGLNAAPVTAQSDTDPSKPKQHFTLADPAGLTPADAQDIYARIKDDMISGYRLSLEGYAGVFDGWARYNTAPYRSAQHGERFVNNYANDLGRAYRNYEASGPMPLGTILVKDSFAVTRKGKIFSGPLFVMEKMAPGFLAASGDWRYTMIMPDGSLFGTTSGQGSERMEFCVTCHARAGAEQDHMFYVPQDFRLAPVE